MPNVIRRRGLPERETKPIQRAPLVFPNAPAAFVAPGRRFRGKQVAPTKVLITIRLDRDVVTAYRSTGAGWQARINDALRRASKRLSRREPQ